jgi:hypothetical protein
MEKVSRGIFFLPEKIFPWFSDIILIAISFNSNGINLIINIYNPSGMKLV